MGTDRQNIMAAGIAAVSMIACTKATAPDTTGDNKTADTGKNPNVILILADDMGFGDISGLNSDSKISTPEIDRLCSSGIVFTNAHASSSMSTPSRYSILTGRYPWRTSLKQGVLNSTAAPMIAKGRPTIGNMFKGNGYSTACIGKWHLGLGWQLNGNDINYGASIEDGPTTRGFDYFYGIAASLDMPPYVYIENDRVTQVPTKILPERTGLQRMRSGDWAEEFIPEDVFPNMTRRTVCYIESRQSSDKPYFLYLPLTAPHTPVLPSAEFSGKSPIGAYGDFVMMIDDMVGQVVKALKATGKYDNTIIIFATDNGCAHYIGTRNMEKQGHYPSYIYRGYKSDIFEGGHRVPLIVSWNGRTSGRKNDSPVCLSDFYATFAQMLGVSLAANEAEDSFSFYDILTGKGKSARTDIVATSNDGSFSLTRNDLKVIFTPTSGGWSTPESGSDVSGLPEMQIYEISGDPKEKCNLYGSSTYKDIVMQYKSAMRDYVRNGRSTPGASTVNDTSDDWKQTRPFMSDN